MPCTRAAFLLSAVFTLVVAAACQRNPPALAAPLPSAHLQAPAGAEQWAAEFAKTPGVGQLGGPRAGLSDAELVLFVRGRAAFRDGPGVAGGLGPHFVQKACGECHAHPVLGGEGTMDPPLVLLAKPGENEVLIFKPKAIDGVAVQAIPPGTVTGKRRAPMLAGVGLIDQVPAELIASHADPEDRDHDGIAGRHNVRKATLARWGLKAHDLTLHRAIVGSLAEDLGLTVAEVEGMSSDSDGVADPEASLELIKLYEAFIGNLASPPPAPKTAESIAGAAVFESAGCAKCHVVDMGPAVGIYSDLLLHDMGAENADGLSDALATPRDWRTAPLWGLRLRKAFFHDNRARNLLEAIDHHRGESEKSRQAVAAVTPEKRMQLMAFLASL